MSEQPHDIPGIKASGGRISRAVEHTLKGRSYRDECLLEANLLWLRQTIDFLESVESDVYAERVPLLDGQSIGPQVRHIIEFYEAFLEGLAQRRIDYSARKRESELERSRVAAIARLRD